MASTINGTSTGSGGLISSGDDSGILNIQTNETTAMSIDASQRVAFVAGTAALPAITTTGDTNTGIFFPAADTIAFSEGGTESMRLDSSGDVNLYNAKSFKVYNSANTRFGSLFTDGNGTNLASHNGSGEPLLLNSPTGYIALSTNGSERARIDSSGNLLVGTTSTSSTSGTGLKITAGSNQADALSIVTSATSNGGLTTYQLYSTGASAYRFYVGAGGTIFATSTVISAISDIRFKENVRDLDVGLDKIMALKPRLYDWKEGKGSDIKNARGFIAQEFETVFPDMIDTWKDPAPEGEEPYKSVRADLIPVLVKAIQEQQAIIETLTQRITALEGAE